MKDIWELRREASQRVGSKENRERESPLREPQIRVCWFCDPGKGFLKSRPEVMQCPKCKRTLFQGYNITLEEGEEPPGDERTYIHI